MARRQIRPSHLSHPRSHGTLPVNLVALRSSSGRAASEVDLEESAANDAEQGEDPSSVQRSDALLDVNRPSRILSQQPRSQKVRSVNVDR